MIKQLRRSDRCLPDTVCRKSSAAQIWLVLMHVFVPRIQGEVLIAGCLVQTSRTLSHFCGPCGVHCTASLSVFGMDSVLWSGLAAKPFPIPLPTAFLSFLVFLFLSIFTFGFPAHGSVFLACTSGSYY